RELRRQPQAARLRAWPEPPVEPGRTDLRAAIPLGGAMGFLDVLKKLVPKSEPMPWDPQSVRHGLFTLRLPEGWRFSGADWSGGEAIGPAGQMVRFYFSARSAGA